MQTAKLMKILLESYTNPLFIKGFYAFYLKNEHINSTICACFVQVLYLIQRFFDKIFYSFHFLLISYINFCIKIEPPSKVLDFFDNLPNKEKCL